VTKAIEPCIPEYWWKARHQSKLEALKHMETDPDILMVGDSITHVWEENMGTEINAKPIWNEFFSDYPTYNIGYCSDCTENVLWRLQNGEIDGISPKVAVLLIGTNNTGIRQDPAEETAMGITAIIDELHLKMPKTAILLLALFPRTDNADYQRINTELNTLVHKQYANSDRVCYLDINDHFFDEKTKAFTQGFLPDGVHLTEDGYRIWAEAMKPTLMEILA
jgi:beta-glucosidase